MKIPEERIGFILQEHSMMTKLCLSDCFVGGCVDDSECLAMKTEFISAICDYVSWKESKQSITIC